MVKNKIALVTGGNKGIGLEICRQLSQRDITVILTARSHERSLQACESLKKEGISVEYRQLDVTAFEDEKTRHHSFVCVSPGS